MLGVLGIPKGALMRAARGTCTGAKAISGNGGLGCTNPHPFSNPISHPIRFGHMNFQSKSSLDEVLEKLNNVQYQGPSLPHEDQTRGHRDPAVSDGKTQAFVGSLGVGCGKLDLALDVPSSRGRQVDLHAIGQLATGVGSSGLLLLAWASLPTNPDGVIQASAGCQTFQSLVLQQRLRRNYATPVPRGLVLVSTFGSSYFRCASGRCRL